MRHRRDGCVCVLARVAWNPRYVLACWSAKFTGPARVSRLRGSKVWDAGQEKVP